MREGSCYKEEHFNDDILFESGFESGNAVWWVRGVICFLLVVSMLLDSVGEMVTVWFFDVAKSMLSKLGCCIDTFI